MKKIMKITITGLAGVGTSTSGKLLAEKLGFDFMSGGNIFRSYAKELEISLNELETRALKDHSFDHELDARQKKYGEESDDFVFESRLGYYFIPDSLKIKFVCDFDERIRRVVEREDEELEEVKRLTLEREEAIRIRYKDLYDIDNFSDDKNFDLIIDTTTTPPEEIVENIVSYIEKMKSESC